MKLRREIGSGTTEGRDRLNIQYQVVNERSRWYAGAMWQVPTATLVGVAVVLVQIQEADKSVIEGIAHIGLGAVVFGILWTFRIFMVLDGRASAHIRDIEAEFPRDITSSDWWIWSAWWMWALFLALLAFALIAFGAYEVIVQ